MDRLFVCLWTAVRRFVRVRRFQTDGVRTKLRTDTRVNYDHINHNHGSDNDNHDNHDCNNCNVAGPHKI